jgi:hypothetical protein
LAWLGFALGAGLIVVAISTTGGAPLGVLGGAICVAALALGLMFGTKREKAEDTIRAAAGEIRATEVLKQQPHGGAYDEGTI